MGKRICKESTKELVSAGLKKASAKQVYNNHVETSAKVSRRYRDNLVRTWLYGIDEIDVFFITEKENIVKIKKVNEITNY